jgi:hypothetical protein
MVVARAEIGTINIKNASVFMDTPPLLTGKRFFSASGLNHEVKWR